MKVVCIEVADPTYGKVSPHSARAREHFAGQGLDVHFYNGVYGSRLGLETTFPYEVDNPGSGTKIGPVVVGCWLSHRTLWAGLLLGPGGPEDEFLILEADAKFRDGWRSRLGVAQQDLPADWDVCFLGSCCTAGKPSRHVAGEVYEVKYPMCLHAYMVRRRALGVMIETQDKARCYAPIDISLTFHTFEKLKVYTVLPRLVDQFDTIIPD